MNYLETALTDKFLFWLLAFTGRQRLLESFLAILIARFQTFYMDIHGFPLIWKGVEGR